MRIKPHGLAEKSIGDRGGSGEALGSSPSSDHLQHVILSLDKSLHVLEPPFLLLEWGLPLWLSR